MNLYFSMTSSRRQHSSSVVQRYALRSTVLVIKVLYNGHVSDLREQGTRYCHLCRRYSNRLSLPVAHVKQNSCISLLMEMWAVHATGLAQAKWQEWAQRGWRMSLLRFSRVASGKNHFWYLTFIRGWTWAALPNLQRKQMLNPLNAELNPICCLLALLGAHHFLHVSRIRVKSLTL